MINVIGLWNHVFLLLVLAIAMLAGSTVSADIVRHETIIVGTENQFSGFSEVVHSLTMSGFSILLIENTLLID